MSYLYSCDCCRHDKLTREQLLNGERCKECTDIRNRDPALFDFFIDLIELKVQDAIIEHEDRYNHSRKS